MSLGIFEEVPFLEFSLEISTGHTSNLYICVNYRRTSFPAIMAVL
jgi:hypothetical protein